MKIDVENLPATYEDAIGLSFKHYFPSEPCPKGHMSARNVSRKECLKCNSEHMRLKYKNDPEYAAYSKGYQKQRNENDEAFAQRKKDRFLEKYRNNPEFRDRYLNRLRLKYVLDSEYRAGRRRICKEYAARNRDKLAASNQLRRAVSRKAKPHWMTSEMKSAIENFYAEARRLTRETGVPHEVDHIAPLNGDGFCGLHVPWNLQILPRFDNRSKHNRLGGDPFAFIQQTVAQSRFYGIYRFIRCSNFRQCGTDGSNSDTLG